MKTLDPSERQALADDPRYRARMRHHAHHLFRGKSGIEISDPEWGIADEG